MDRLLDIGSAIRRHARGDELTATALAGVSVVCTTRTTEPIGHVQEPTFTLIAGGAKETALNGEVHRYGAGEFLVTSVDLPLVGSIVAADRDAPFLAVAFRLDAERIASLLLDTGLPGLPTAAPSSAFGVHHAPASLLDAVARRLDLLDHPGDVTALGAGVEREILWRLLTGPYAGTLRQIGIADSRLTHLTRAVRWIREHYDEPLRIADLAETAAMSPSSFHRHFLAVTSMTPLEYQKHLRLNEARMRLLTGEHEVAKVGSAVGYASPSQFSREYRRMFGTAPSHTTVTASPASAPRVRGRAGRSPSGSAAGRRP